MARNVSQTAPGTNAAGVWGFTVQRFAFFFLFAILSGCRGEARTAPVLPPPSAPVSAAGQKSAGQDWSFLGPENPQLVREQAGWIRPVAGEGNLAEDDFERLQRRSAAVAQWVEHHAKLAASGAAGVVHLPWTHCVGWGSRTPSDYTLFGCFTPAAVFVHARKTPDFVSACRRCGREDAACIERHCGVRLVEGRFTGKTQSVRLDPETTETKTSYEVEVFRDRPLPAPADAEEIMPEMELVLPAGSPPPDGPVWTGPRLAAAARLEMVWAPSTRALAERKLQELAAAGFADAFVLDSRRAPAQWCCALLVVAQAGDARAPLTAALDRLNALWPGEFQILELY